MIGSVQVPKQDAHCYYRDGNRNHLKPYLSRYLYKHCTGLNSSKFCTINTWNLRAELLILWTKKWRAATENSIPISNAYYMIPHCTGNIGTCFISSQAIGSFSMIPYVVLQHISLESFPVLSGEPRYSLMVSQQRANQAWLCPCLASNTRQISGVFTSLEVLFHGLMAFITLCFQPHAAHLCLPPMNAD